RLQQLPHVLAGRLEARVGVRPRDEGKGGIQHLSRRLGAMKPWERVVFGLAALAVLAAIGVKLHELDMPVARFVRSFDIGALNLVGDELFLGPSLDSGLDSFPSGHAANAFGAATVLAWFFPSVRTPLYLVAGLVAVSRVLRGSHFPTDVWAGAVLGVMIGSMVVVGLKRWPDDALPGLLRTGMPVAGETFSILWIA